MRWILKSVAQTAFSVLPYGHKINRLFQGDLTRLIPAHQRHLNNMAAVLTGEMHVAVEIGTGWCPTVPLGLTSRGIHVHTYDHVRHVTPETLAASQRAVGGDWSMVEYHAPGDAACTELPGNSVDLHFSIAVLEHIPVRTIEALLREAYRVLRPGGVLYHEIDLRDHFADFDPSISSVNFLKFGNSTWKLLGQNSIQYHNRLRASDHIRLFQDAGFGVASAKIDVSNRGLDALRSMHVTKQFTGYDADDLAASWIILTATKPAHPSGYSQRPQLQYARA